RAMRTDYKLWPYGAYFNRGFVYLYDRHYRPIICAPWIDLHLFENRQIITLATPWATCEPSNRVLVEGQAWFYRDATSPTRDRQTRAKLKKLIDDIPTLAAEIKRRQAVRT